MLLPKMSGEIITRVKEDGATILHTAVQSNSYDIKKAMKMLLHVYPEYIHVMDKKGRSILHLAAKNCYRGDEIIPVLVKRCPHLLKIVDNERRSVLHYVCGYSRGQKIIKMLIEKEPELMDMIDGYGENALHCVRNGQTCKVLMQKAPQLINMVNKYKRSPLHKAVYGHYIEVIEMLLPYTNYENINRLISVLFKLEGVKITEEGCSLLHLTSKVFKSRYNDQCKIFQMIMNIHPQLINVVTHRGYTVLHLLVLQRHEIKVCDSMKLLLDYSPNMANIVDKMGCTALHYVVKYPSAEPLKRIAMVELILSRMDFKAICAVNTEGKTAMDMATEANFLNAVEIIQKRIKIEEANPELNQN